MWLRSPHHAVLYCCYYHSCKFLFIALFFLISQGFFTVLSWMPIYFSSVRFIIFSCDCQIIKIFRNQQLEPHINGFPLQVYRVDLRHAAWFSAVPWALMAVMGYFAGLWSDMMIQSGTSVTLTRKIMQVCCIAYTRKERRHVRFHIFLFYPIAGSYQSTC